MKAIGYVRVSTEEQLHGNGLTVQREAIKKFCKAENARLVEVFSDEGISGSTGLEHRLGLASALVMLEAGNADCLVVYRLDRLARDYVLQELLVARLREGGTPVRSVMEPDIATDTDDPTKILLRQILGSIGEYERALIQGRMQAGKMIKAAKGGYIGGQPCYGKVAEDKELANAPAEADVVRLIHSLRAEGRSYREICADLGKAGITPRRARHWQPAVIRAIALRPVQR